MARVFGVLQHKEIADRFDVLEDRRLLRRPGTRTWRRVRACHGLPRGDSLADIYAIRRLDQLGYPHIGEYQSDYRLAYGIPFDVAAMHLETYPSEFWAVCDMRACVAEQDWILSRRYAVVLGAERIISDVRTSPACLVGGLFEDGGILQEPFERLLRRFHGT
jgi:hypothetical protein